MTEPTEDMVQRPESVFVLFHSDLSEAVVEGVFSTRENAMRHLEQVAALHPERFPLEALDMGAKNPFHVEEFRLDGADPARFYEMSWKATGETAGNGQVLEAGE